MTKYFIGSQLAKLRSEWSHLQDNSGPSALVPTAFYAYCLKIITSVEDRINPKSNFHYTAKSCYAHLLQVIVSAPLLPGYWRSFVGNDFSIRCHWSSVHDRRTENFKNDIAWLLTLRGTKIRDSLKVWGYVASDLSAYCESKETIDHCFLKRLSA